MSTLVLDGRTGASGDMLLGALLAAGADPEVLAPVEDALDVTYEIREVDERGITATNVTVEHGESDAQTGESAHSHDGHSHDDGYDDHTHDDHESGHSHGDGHSHDHAHDDHAHGHDAEGHGPARTYPEVVDVVESMALPAGVEANALAIFELLGEAEASVHGTDLSETHFHEVGADDAIADVVGVVLLLADLDVDRVLTTPVAVGGGEVSMSHGTYPVPAPAVVELLERANWSTYGGPVETELLTPTGAAVLAHVAEGVAERPEMDLVTSGYGAGTKDLPERPNALRALVGETAEGGESRARAQDSADLLHQQDIAVLETNLDDCPPEVLGSLQETLTEAGARDISIVPLTMKKSRPGHLVKVIARPEDADAVAQRLAEETGTLGVRGTPATHRWTADRDFETVSVEFDGVSYDVSVKIASGPDGDVYDASAEYDDALRVAQEVDVPVREVIRRAESALD
jgi:uncharacterized protein (TIGR00299 family) protein